MGCSFGDTLVMLVRDHTGDKSWDNDPRTAINLSNGMLHVMQTPRVHKEIETFLRYFCS